MQLTLDAYLLPYLITPWSDLGQLRLVLSIEDKKNYLEHHIPATPVAPPRQQVPPAALAAHAAWVKGQKEVAVLMLLTMDLEIQRNLAHLGAYDMLQELKAMYSKQDEHELLQTVREFHISKQEEGQSVSSHVLKMKGYIKNLERLGQPAGQNLAVSLILVSLNKDFDSFVQNYNMHGMGKTVKELHAMLKLHEETLPKKDVNPTLYAIRAGRAEGQLVSSHVLKMKGYIENLERLGQPVGQNLAVSLILVSLNKDFDNFAQNDNMHGMGKTMNELHAMLKLHEETLPKKDVNPALHVIRAGRVQKNQKNKSCKAGKGSHGKGKGKMGNASNNASFASKPKTPQPPKKDNPAKDAICHQCGEVGHWRRNCP
nr:zinc finger, CCHC-type [Tanacetum cinerariifolium]